MVKFYKDLLEEYKSKYNKPLKPAKHRADNLQVPNLIRCLHCKGPHQFIYFNDGKKRAQLKCKICKNTFKIYKQFKKLKKDLELFCPYCNRSLYKWKARSEVTIYKCSNRQCKCRQGNLKNLKPSEKMMQILRPTNFKINYQYREYHFTPEQLEHSKPEGSKVNIFKIHSSQNLLGLILSLHISFAMSAKQTALFIRMVFNVSISAQTVRNYAEAAAHYCHKFNIENKGAIDSVLAGDETYIKVKGKHHYVWFFISSRKKTIIAYHVDNNRGTLPAVISIMEAKRTARENQKLTLVTDGNPSYQAGLNFIYEQPEFKNIKVKPTHIKVIGLENLDKDSTDYRAYKQIIERLNRTYKFHYKPSTGFNNINSAVTLTTLFVSHYNFLRPHKSLEYKSPVRIEELKGCVTIQEKWLKMISMAA